VEETEAADDGVGDDDGDEFSEKETDGLAPRPPVLLLLLLLLVAEDAVDSDMLAVLSFSFFEAINGRSYSRKNVLTRCWKKSG